MNIKRAVVLIIVLILGLGLQACVQSASIHRRVVSYETLKLQTKNLKKIPEKMYLKLYLNDEETRTRVDAYLTVKNVVVTLRIPSSCYIISDTLLVSSKATFLGFQYSPDRKVQPFVISQSTAFILRSKHHYLYPDRSSSYEVFLGNLSIRISRNFVRAKNRIDNSLVDSKLHIGFEIQCKMDKEPRKSLYVVSYAIKTADVEVEEYNIYDSFMPLADEPELF